MTFRRLRSPLLLGFGIGVVAFPVESTGRAGRGVVGNWELVWQLSEDAAPFNRFSELYPEQQFPIRWRMWTGLKENRLVFFDAAGESHETVPLQLDERILVSDDATTYVRWHPLNDGTGSHEISYHRRFGAEAEWDATAIGTPKLISSDGSILLITHLERMVAGLYEQPGTAKGHLQIVGSAGEIRGELPVYPPYCQLTGDQRSLALLFDGELAKIRRDGTFEWSRRIPIDQVSAREGSTPLATGGSLIAACGTGIVPREQRNTLSLYPPRHGVVLVHDSAGNLLWRVDQPADEDPWVSLTARVTPDGERVVTCHSSPLGAIVRLYEGVSGELLWERRARRGEGLRSLSISDDGERILLAYGKTWSRIFVWDAEGKIVWEGDIPLSSRVVVLEGHDLLVADRWVVRLEYDPRT